MLGRTASPSGRVRADAVDQTRTSVINDRREDPGSFEIAVGGGAAGRGVCVYGAGEPVTMLVEE